jgi:hypothetical protein
VRRPFLIALALAAVLGATSCGGKAGQGDPKCFGENAGDHTCTSSEGVLYRVVDRGHTATIPGALGVRLIDVPRPITPTTVGATVVLLPAGPYDGDIALQQAKGTIFIPEQRVRNGDRLELTWVLPRDAVDKLDRYPSYLTFFQTPDRCPGRKAQCFAYIRLWK